MYNDTTKYIPRGLRYAKTAQWQGRFFGNFQFSATIPYIRFESKWRGLIPVGITMHAPLKRMMNDKK
jgi:hypothetical protein